MTKVAPITDEELARLERLYAEAREERHEEEESGEANSTIARCLFHDEAEERLPSLLARLRAAEARAETAEREMGALVAKVHEVYAQGHNGPLWKVREWMNAHVTGAKNEGTPQ